MQKSIDDFSRSGPAKDPLWSDFAKRLSFVPGSFDDADAFTQLRKQIEQNDAGLGTGGNRLFYLSTPPSLFGQIIDMLEEAGLGPKRQQDRLDAHHHRETVRNRSRFGARAASRSQQGVRREERLSHRPLPRQRAGAGHHGPAVRERDLRTALEPPLRRLRADHRRRDRRGRRARRLLRQRRRAARHDPEPRHELARAGGDGAAGLADRR